MSGIAGIYSPDGRVLDREELRAIMEALAHRGPDACGIWTQGNVGLAHRMLWTTSESLHEKLPVENDTGDLVLTSDARLDNRDELIAALELPSALRQTIADSELILTAYERWGESCPEKLLGDFAFALWDRRKQTIFCARDHVGVKPLYYFYRSGGLFVFGSEVKALFAYPSVPRELNEVMMANYLRANFEDTSATFYKHVLRLPPGHCMTVSKQGLRLRCYWALDPSRELRLRSDQEYAEALSEIFTQAVQCRLRSAFPLGAELSGGLDSSSVTCMARKLLSRNGTGRLHTFSATFPEVPESDERSYIEAVLAEGGLNPHFVPCDRLNPLGDIERFFWHLDEPFWAPSMFMYSALYSAAQARHVRVLLGGDDGDNAVGYGIDYMAALIRRGRWIAAAREVSGLATHFNRSRWRVLKTYGLRPLIPEPILRFRELLKSGWDSEPGDLLNPAFARVTASAGDHNCTQLSKIAAQRALLEQWSNLTDGVIPYGCEMFDKAAAGFSIELRYPFLDRRVLDFCLAVPASQKLHRGWIRMIMRRAMKGILPEQVRWRGGKATLTPNFNRALSMFAAETLDEVVMKDSKVLEPYVNLMALRKRYQQYLSGDANAACDDIWSAVTLALWLRYTEAATSVPGEEVLSLQLM